MQSRGSPAAEKYSHLKKKKKGKEGGGREREKEKGGGREEGRKKKEKNKNTIIPTHQGAATLIQGGTRPSSPCAQMNGHELGVREHRQKGFCHLRRGSGFPAEVQLYRA